MRYRFATAEDLDQCHRLIHPGFRADPGLHARIPALWRKLIAQSPSTITVIEDAESQHDERIEVFAACVFVSDGFAAAFLASPRPFLAAHLYQHPEEILIPSAIREGNVGRGLNLVCLHFGMRHHDIAHPRTRAALQVANTAFFFFFAGYRINLLLQEVYGAQHAAYLEAGGLRRLSTFTGDAAANASVEPDHRPQLFGLRKEEVTVGAVNPLSYFFHALPPRLHFSIAAQRVLERAMLNQGDAEIAEVLGVSLDAVKKTWRLVYQRVDDLAPRLLAGAGAAPAPVGRRSVERRRHLLEYLRTHLEELRPNLPVRRRGTSRTRGGERRI